jgi:hypothetical protein
MVIFAGMLIRIGELADIRVHPQWFETVATCRKFFARSATIVTT